MGASIESGGSKSKTRRRLFLGVCIAAVVAGLAVGIFFMHDACQTPFYSATITAVSGLDDAAETPAGHQPTGTFTLSPAFNLTVGVASRSRRLGARIGAGTAVKVCYSQLRLPMATGRVPEMRAGPRETRLAPAVVATGRDVAVPGFLMDSLADEMRTGDAMFEVQLIQSDEFGWWNVAKGWGRVGETVRLYEG